MEIYKYSIMEMEIFLCREKVHITGIFPRYALMLSAGRKF